MNTARWNEIQFNAFEGVWSKCVSVVQAKNTLKKVCKLLPVGISVMVF
jgi:hypothetical protein